MNVEALRGALHDRIDALDEVEMRGVYQFIEELKHYKDHRRIPVDKIWEDMVARYGGLLERLGKE